MPQDIGFDFGGIDQPSALLDLTDALNQALDEHQEAVQTRRRLDEQTIAVSEERIDMAKSRARQTREFAVQQEQLIDELDAKLQRIDEIEGNFFLQMLEPLAETFAPEYSRKGLARDIETTQAQLELLSQRERLEAAKTTAKMQEQEATLNKTKAELAKERGDFTDLAQVIDLQSSGRENIQAQREMIIANTGDEELETLVAKGIMSERRLKQEKRLRKSQELTARTQQIQSTLNEIQLQDTLLSRMTDAQLNSPEVAKQYPTKVIEEQKRKNAAEKLAFRNLQLQNKVQERAEASATLSDEELNKRVANGTMTEEERKQIVQDREAKESSNEAQKLRNAREHAAAEQEATTLFLANRPVVDLKKLGERALASGGVVKITVNGQPLTLTSQQISEQLNAKLKGQVELATTMSIGNTTEVATSAAMQEVSRATGQAVTEDATTLSQLDELIRNTEQSAEVREQAQAAKSQLEAANNSTVDSETQLLLQERATQQIKALNEQLTEQRLSTVSKEQQPHVKEYLKTGKISSNEGAVTILATAGVTNEQTGFKHYDAALKDLTNLALGRGVEDDDELTEAAQQRKLQITSGSLSPAEAIATFATDEQNHGAIASPIVSTVLAEVHAMAADKVGDKALANGIRSGGAFDNKQFNEVRIFQVLKEHQVDFSEYLEALRTSALGTVDQLITADGRNGHIMASLNRLLFGDRPAQYVRQELLLRAQQASGTIERVEREQNKKNQRAIESNPFLPQI